ncbi:hypothetical protein [Stenotrophomonas sp. PSU-St83]
MMFHLLCRFLRRLTLGVSMLLPALAAQAGDVYITAEFKPDLTNPNQRGFVNTTPWSGVCANAHMATCIANNWWSIDTTVRGSKEVIRNADYGPDGFYIAMPAPRIVTVTSEDGASSFDLTLRVIGAAMRFTDEDRDGASSGFYSSGGPNNCSYGVTGSSAYTVMRMLLRRDDGQGAVACGLHWVNTNNYAIPALDFVYALETPAPLEMRSGIYTGSTRFSFGGTGQGSDFDLGHRVSLSDSLVNVHFRLEVRHAFRLDVAPGMDHAVLAPKGGWSQWTDHGIAPARLQQEVPFHISSSGQFSVSMQCEHLQADGRCWIRNTSVDADDVPLDVSLTLPGFRDRASGRQVVDLPLRVNQAPPVFTADAVIIGRSSTLRFAVNGEPVRKMLDHPGTTYQGSVTVVFDADP